jgi:tetratricopeptide (TPR) repeat protein
VIRLIIPCSFYAALLGRWRYSLLTGTLTTTLQVAQRVYSLAQEQTDSALMIGAYHALAGTLYFIGDFKTARRYAERGVQLWRAGGAESHAEEVLAPTVVCLCYEALSDWHLGESASCKAIMAQANSLATELKNTNPLAVALWNAVLLGHYARNPAEVERLTSDLIELSTRNNFPFWLSGANILRGWTRSVSGELGVPYFFSLKAEALYLAHRTSEALEAISEAEALVERSEDRHWCAELHRLRGVFLTAIVADEVQSEVSFCAAIRTAKEQKSISLEKRAEGTYAEYRRQKASASGERGFRLPLC